MNTKTMFSSDKENWCTPKRFFKSLNAHFNFDLDAAASKENALCEKYITKENNALVVPWDGQRIFVNPPYGRNLRSWANKIVEEASTGRKTIVALVPARTDTQWFFTLTKDLTTEVYFISGRLHFNETKTVAPFPSALVILNHHWLGHTSTSTTYFDDDKLLQFHAWMFKPE